MKISLLQHDLSVGLALVSRFVATRGQLPVLSHVLIEAHGADIVLSATNLEQGLRVRVAGKVETEGSITVPAKNFSELVNSFESAPVLLSVSSDRLKIQCGSYSGSMSGISSAEFPSFARATSDKPAFLIRKDMLLNVAARVAFAAANEESRPVLTGVQWRSESGTLYLTATDGFRMSRFMISDPEAFAVDQKLIFPAKTIQELSKIVTDGKKETVEVYVSGDENQVVFVYDTVQLVSRLLEGNFPDVTKIIPTEYTYRVFVDTSALIRAIRTASVFARESNNIVRFRLNTDRVTVFAAASQTGEGQVEIDAEASGGDLEVAFNFRYVMDYLTSFSSERVIFESTGALAPGVWKQEGNDQFVYIVMPVRV